MRLGNNKVILTSVYVSKLEHRVGKNLLWKLLEWNIAIKILMQVTANILRHHFQSPKEKNINF